MDSKPDSLSELKIKRNTYSFVQRKRYTPTKNYVVKKSKSDSPLQNFLDDLKQKRRSKKEFGTKSQQTKKASAPTDGKHPVSIALKFAAGAFAVIFLLLLFFMFILQSSGSDKTQVAPSFGFNGTFDAAIYDAGLITYGPQDNPSLQGYAIVDYTQTGLSYINITATLYPVRPSRQVFVLEYPRDGADTYSDFRKTFDSQLQKKGWAVDDIKIDDLASLPPHSTLIIPTGYLPKSLLGSSDKSNPSIIDLASNGTVVIYLGQPFDEHVLSESGTPIATDKSLYSNMGFEFLKTSKLSSSDGFGLQAPLYTVQAKSTRANMLWGSISQLYAGSGYLLLLPQSLDGGWAGDGNAAGNDIARLVYEEPFRPILRTSSFLLKDPSPFGRQTLFFEPMQDSSAFMRLKYIISDKNNAIEEGFIDWPVYRSVHGDLYIDDPVFLPKYLGGGRKTVTAQLREPQESQAKLFFELYQNGTSVEQTAVEQGLTSTQIVRSSPVQFNQDPGAYILRVVDKFGYVYAATKIEIAGLEIRTLDGKYPTYSFVDGDFNFTFYSQDRRIKVPSVTLTLKNYKNAPVRQYSNIDFINYHPGIELKRGNYTFVFDFGEGYVQQKILQYNLAVNIWERPEVLFLGFVAVLVFGAGIILRRPQKELFALDIPDFPPHTVRKIPLSQGRIVSIFEQINKDYRWTNMPLSIEELKAGFRKVLVDGKPIIIGDYNLERLLESLKGRGILSSELGYWAPSSWAQESGFGMKLLSTYRFLRDIFVNNAVRFTKLGSSGECDVKILLGKTQYYLHVFLGDEQIARRALETVDKGYTWIIFENDSEKQKFERNMRTSASAYLVLKMHVEGGRVRLFSLDELPSTIKRMRVD
ncbi:MAG: hypothetical protein WC492_03550 [Candidatus Micrarchaeia archaeon]